MPEHLVENLQRVQAEIAKCANSAGRNEKDIRLIAVSKTRSLEEVEVVAALGQTAFGENTVQDALTKITHINIPDVEWHFIGHLQSKKSPKVAEYFSWIHSIDSLKLAEKISNAVTYAGKDSINALIQVNVSGESSKSGISPDEVIPFLEAVLEADYPGIQWRGLMTIGVKADEDVTRAAFSHLRKLQLFCQSNFRLPRFDQLSMGMSGDYCLAIEEGATMIRIGTSIFGCRDSSG